MQSSEDLPYGPLPVRSGEPMAGPSEQPDQFEDISWLEQEPPPGPAESVEEEDSSEQAVGLSIASPAPEADDDVHFGVAARALGVSRKTVERMVKRGQLERGPSQAPATVSKRALVAALEQRRRDVTHLTRATAVEQAKSESASPTGDSAQELRELLLPVLAPLLDEFISVRTRAAVLENQLANITARMANQRTRDELLFALATSGWWGRRKARRAVLRHCVLGDDYFDANSSED
jgi:hypothetical protein